jgi:hypothetical protein
MQGHSPNPKAVCRPGIPPLINPLAFHPETATPQQQDTVQSVRLENQMATKISSRILDSATLIAKNAAH